MHASPIENTKNQFLELENYDIDNKIMNIPVTDHSQIAYNTDKQRVNRKDADQHNIQGMTIKP